MVIASLRPLGADFGEATNGLEAIEKLVVDHYDAMTLDLNMPDMHGLEVIRFVRQHQSFRDLPIVVLSTRSDPAVQTEAARAGASLYLTKPFSRESLLDSLQSLLSGLTGKP